MFTWSLLCLAGTSGGPIRKTGCGMVHFHQDKLEVIGGYGILSGPIPSLDRHLSSTLMKSTCSTSIEVIISMIKL